MIILYVTKTDKRLHNESGGHRIQRIPPTEKRGRVHTSTVTVAVLEDIKSDPRYDMRDEEHFYKEWFSGTGNGGQHRNKHQNSLRLYHTPTGLLTTEQGKSRTSNEATAMKRMNKMLDEMKYGASQNDLNDDRQSKIGSGMRADKIRTYRFQDDQVNDHQTGKKTTCKRIMRGHFDDLWK
jgi:peptide chain release factor 1